MVLCLLGVMAAAGGLAQRADAAPSLPSSGATTDAAVVRGHIDVIQLNGLIDPIEADFVRQAIGKAERNGAIALVVQLSSTGGVISPTSVNALALRISSSKVPVAIWVGPNGSRAYGTAYAVFRAAPLRGVAPGIRVGNAPPLPNGAPDPLANRTIGAGEALATKVATISAPTFGDFVVSLDGQTVDGTVLHTAEVYQGPNGELRRRPTVDTDFRKLTIIQQLLHTAASPSVAYLLLLIGMLLAALEFFTAGIGIAAFCGAGALVLASYGLGVLPIRPWALVLLIVGVFGFCIDVQAGVARVWTAIGSVAIVVGTFELYQHVHLPRAGRGGRYRGHGAFHDRRHAGDGQGQVLHPDHRTRLHDRRDGYRPGRHRARGNRRGARGTLAGPHQSGNTHSRGSTCPGGGHRRSAARGRAGDRRRQGRPPLSAAAGGPICLRPLGTFLRRMGRPQKSFRVERKFALVGRQREGVGSPSERGGPFERAAS